MDKTDYLILLGTAAFIVQSIRTYIAWREWRWKKYPHLKKAFRKGKNRGEGR